MKTLSSEIYLGRTKVDCKFILSKANHISYRMFFVEGTVHRVVYLRFVFFLNFICYKAKDIITIKVLL